MLVRFSGTSTNDDSPTPTEIPNESVLVYENESTGDFHTVLTDEELILRNVPPAAIMTFFGYSAATLDAIFEFNASEQKFLGILITISGFIIRAVSQLASTIRVIKRLKRDLVETDDQFLTRICDFTPDKGRQANFFQRKVDGDVKPVCLSLKRIEEKRPPRPRDAPSYR
jgi:hypothetical protein